MICPSTMQPCCDDLCHGAGCLAMNGYPMLEECAFCGGTIDESIPDCSTCTCLDGDEYPEWEDDD